MKLALIFFFSLRLTACYDFDILVNVVKMISNSNYFGFLVILYSEEEANGKLFYEKLAKLLQAHLKFSMIVQVSIEHYKQYKNGNENMKCLKILNGRSETVKQKFLNLSKEVNLGDGDLWLLLLDDPSELYLNSLTLPFDIQLITASIQNSVVHLKAPYKVADNFPLRISNLGQWNSTEVLDVPAIELDVTKRDLEGINLISGTINYPPVTSIKHYRNGEFSVHGYLIDIWKEVSEKLNFTYKFILPPDKGVGSERSDGSWNGLMGMMMRNEIDVIVTALVMTPSRNRAIDFSVPVMTSSFQVFFLEAGNKHLELGSLLRPFKKESWLAILGWIIIATLTLYIIYRIGCRFNIENRLFKREYTISGSLFTVFRAFVNQGNDKVPQSLSSRIVFYLTYFIMALLLPAYSAALISYITIQTPVKPFRSLESMVTSGTHKLMPAQKTADYDFFSHASDSLLQQAFEKLVEPIKESTLPRNPKEGIEMVCKIKNVAYFGCELSARMFADEYFMKKGCKFMTFEDPVTYIYKGIVFPKNSPYFLAINAELKRMILKGLIRRYEKDVWSRKIEIADPHFHAIQPLHVIQIYCVFLGGFFLSVFIFIAETFNCKKE